MESRNLACGTFLFSKSFLWLIFFHKKIWPAAHFFNLLLNHSVVHLISSFLFCLPIHWWCKWFELQYSVVTTTQFVPNSNEKCVKWQTLCQIKPREIQIAQHQFSSMTFHKKQRMSTHAGNINITITRLVSILLHFHAVSSRLLLNLWHINDREPKVHFFAEIKSHIWALSPVHDDHPFLRHILFL